ncbi:MarR family winged helix-turn-helix transcriptional regulator [Streptomyces sp. NPDC047023]|uniref:MarR family winged helix-turn-helix transcriptional regulator n=1 Tax=Streptomyces sp. NPDC047023 TaxID=3155139 RepID=UPI0033FD5039
MHPDTRSGRPQPPAQDPELCLAVNQAARTLSHAIASGLSRLGLTVGQLPALLALYAEDGLTQAALAQRTQVEQPTMALTLRRMERDGLITRTPDPSDGRRALVLLTPKAKALRDDVQSLRSSIDRKAATGLSDLEQEMLHRLLNRVIANLHTETPPPRDTRKAAGPPGPQDPAYGVA